MQIGITVGENSMTDKTLDDGLSQVYLQISPNILESFPKFRPPVALYKFDENIAQVKLFHKAEERLGKDKQAEVADYAQDSLLFSCVRTTRSTLST